jgi:hypothetical protein
LVASRHQLPNLAESLNIQALPVWVPLTTPGLSSRRNWSSGDRSRPSVATALVSGNIVPTDGLASAWAMDFAKARVDRR